MAWDSIWEDIFKNSEWGKYPSEDLIRFVARNFYKSNNKDEIRILEVGCGPGANIWYIAREGFNAYGIDGSKTAVDNANLRLDREVPGWKGEIVVGDFTRIPYENDFFDAVIDSEAIYVNSFEDSKLILDEIHRVLKIGGKLYSRTFAIDSWGYGTGEKIGYNMWLVNEGPLKGKGTSRFTSEEDINELYGEFRLSEIELNQYSYNNRSNTVREWTIIAEKTK